MWRKGNPSGAAAGASALDVIDHHDDCEAEEYERGDRIGNALQSRIPRVVGPAHGLEHRPYTVCQVEPQRSEPQQIDEDIIPLRERVSDQRSTVGCRDGAAADQRRVAAQDFDELHLRPEVEEMQCQTGQHDESDDQHVFRGPGHARLGDCDGIALLASCAIIVHGENQRERENLTLIKNQYDQEEAELARLRQQLAEYESRHQQTAQNLEIAQKSALDLQDESTEELQKNIADIDEINRKVRANSDKEKAEMDAAEYKEKYEELTVKIDNIREQRTALLDQAPLPLPGLSVQEGELIYNGQKWDNMSGSDQSKLKPECGFVLLDKLEQMDMATLQEFGVWLEQEGLQAIATRVSVGDE